MAAKADSSVIQNLPADDELKFMIQISTSAKKKALTPENFKGLKEITELPYPDRFRYAAGSFPSYTEAVEYRKKIEVLYPDAFVIAVKNNKILPLHDALNSK